MKTIADFPPEGVQLLALALCALICIVAGAAWALFHNDDQ